MVLKIGLSNRVKLVLIGFNRFKPDFEIGGINRFLSVFFGLAPPLVSNPSFSSFAEQQEEKRKESLIKAKQSQEVHKEAAINNDKFSTPDVAILVKVSKLGQGEWGP